MGFRMDEFILIVRMLLFYTLGTQVMYGVTILLLERTMVNFYLSAIVENPTNIIHKSTNLFMKAVIGTGYLWYSKFAKYNWFLRKILILFGLVIQIIASIILYQIIIRTLTAIFL
ncbi:hypothetical protein Q9251_18595 [Alkalihalobacillus macyae]|uniref:hypothetical protein n=1 Tax=Guptibacillus hwajinpoensis TaxID=208199 RepID=UPI00273B9C88|nr:hypothetical protein [Alkalihalobacillus macyae]MDP4552892.1 hypothetical protein [Alkalihalobacillus macyae]